MGGTLVPHLSYLTVVLPFCGSCHDLPCGWHPNNPPQWDPRHYSHTADRIFAAEPHLFNLLLMSCLLIVQPILNQNDIRAWGFGTQSKMQFSMYRFSTQTHQAIIPSLLQLCIVNMSQKKERICSMHLWSGIWFPPSPLCSHNRWNGHGG